MKLSSRTEYGLRALLDLAQHAGPGLVQSSDIAARQQIPDTYLDQLLLTLRRAGLVDSVRGPQGGHRLAQPPRLVTLADVVVALQGRVLSVKGEPGTGGKDEPVEAEIVREVWHEVERAVRATLESVTLEDLRQCKLEREQQVMYHI